MRSSPLASAVALAGVCAVVAAGVSAGVLAGCASAPVEKTAPPPAPAAPAPTTTKSGAPLTKKIEVTDTYQGVAVRDPYRWLESADSADVDAFTDAQNAVARASLDPLPGREALRARLAEILGATTIVYSDLVERSGAMYAMKLQPPKQHAFLVAMPSPEKPDQERVVVDPDVVDPSKHTAIDWYRVSPDGKLVAVSMSSGGSETGDVHVFETATGKAVDEVIPGVNAGTAGGDLAWLNDSSGFYYSRYPRGAERPAADKLFYVQLYLHKLGSKTDVDTYEIGKQFGEDGKGERIAEVFVDVDSKSGAVLCSVQKGDGGEFVFFLKEAKKEWRQLAKYEDDVVQMVFGEKSDLYAISVKGAPHGKLLHGPIAGFDLAKTKVVIAESKETLIADIWSDPLVVVGGRIYARYQLGGPSEIRVFDLDGKPQPGPQLLPISSVGDVVPLKNGDVLYANGSFVDPLVVYRFNPKKKQTTKTALATKFPVDLTGVTVVREMATSKDGTQVPVNILLPRGVKPGAKIPFVVTGYGGYGVNIEPGFQASKSVILDAGVGLAIVNLRGGGEFGESWHAAGALTHKQNVFDDFAAALDHLVKQGHAAPGKIAITGGSNGGLLMGAMLTQQPEKIAAVASFVGIYDMLRVESEPNGVFNTTEFGSVADKAQFDALYAYSPYHHVKDGTAFPPTLFIIGKNDVRVAPWHSRKMLARLQAASSSTSPILLTTTSDAGHGIGSGVDTIVAQNTDAFSFLLTNLGVTYAAPAATTTTTTQPAATAPATTAPTTTAPTPTAPTTTAPK